MHARVDFARGYNSTDSILKILKILFKAVKEAHPIRFHSKEKLHSEIVLLCIWESRGFK